MKKPQTVKIIADKPAPGQSSISHLIGRTFSVVSINRDKDGKPDGTLNIDDGRGSIILQREEYEVVP